MIYLDGNSLGPPVRDAGARLQRFATDEWGTHLIGGWDRDGWISAGARLGRLIAPWVGAADDEVIVCDSTTINLHKLLHAALRLRPTRRVVLAAADDFPTDMYVVDAVAELCGCTVRRADAHSWRGIDLSDVAVGVLSHVHYRTGQLHDLAELTADLHAQGALALWDLSHSVGAVPIALDAADVDLAVGCTYKFLNGGPGAPAFAYVARGLQAATTTPIVGWLGHADPFAMAHRYRPAAGVERLVTGTPSVIGQIALEHALAAIGDVDVAHVRQKAMALGELFTDLVDQELPGVFTLHSPRQPTQRGGHIALGHPDGYAIIQALIARGVVGDFRAPDVLRFGFASMYLSFTQVFDAAMILSEVMRSGAYEDFRSAQRGRVT